MAEHGEYRSIFTTLADDEEFIATSPLAKAVFYTLKLKLPAVGIGSVAIQSVAALVGAPRSDVEVALDELAPKWVQREKSLCWIVNGLLFHPNLSPRDPKHRKYVATQFGALPRTVLADAFRQHYPQWFPAHPETLPSVLDNPSKALPSVFEAPSQGHGSTKTANNYEDRTAVDCCHTGVIESTLEGPSASAYSLALVVAANQGMTANPAIGDRLNPIANGPGKSFEASEEIREAGVDLEFARSAVFDLAKTFKPTGRSKQISSLGYFAGAVVGRWQDHRAMQAAAATPLPSDAPPRSARRPSTSRGCA